MNEERCGKCKYCMPIIDNSGKKIRLLVWFARGTFWSQKKMNCISAVQTMKRAMPTRNRLVTADGECGCVRTASANDPNEKRWTQAQLAERAHLSAGWVIGRYELGHDYPRIDTAVNLAHALEVSLDYLCGMKEEMT